MTRFFLAIALLVSGHAFAFGDVQPAGSTSAGGCLSASSLTADAIPGAVVWRINLANTTANDCTVPSVDFPAVLDEGIVNRLPFEPDFGLTRFDAAGGACQRMRDSDVGGGVAIKCSGLTVPANSAKTVRIWTGALQKPPYRYCLSGFITQASAESIAACVDVYAESPLDGVVLEGPIGVSSVEVQWIGGNYPGATAVPEGGTITRRIELPSGKPAVVGQGALGPGSAWSCSVEADQVHLDCTLHNAPIGLLPAIKVYLPWSPPLPPSGPNPRRGS